MRNKYAALGSYLATQRREEVPMSFADVERITGETLPPSARRHRPWWSNNPNNSVMTKVWLEAGFKTERVDMAREMLVFRRLPSGRGTPSSGVAARAEVGRGAMRTDTCRPAKHPIFGALKGLMVVPEDVDLTQPADPDWAEIVEGRT